MIEYALKYPEKLYGALGQHLVLVGVTLVLSLVLAAVLTVCAMYYKTVSNALVHLFSVVYSIPSLAMFAMLIPVTGLGTKTALIVLTLYNQYLLLRNFTAGLNGVDSAIIEHADPVKDPPASGKTVHLYRNPPRHCLDYRNRHDRGYHQRRRPGHNPF